MGKTFEEQHEERLQGFVRDCTADIEKLRSTIPELKEFSSMDIASFYNEFSEKERYVGWAPPHDRIVEMFKEWLLVPRIKRDIRWI